MFEWLLGSSTPKRSAENPADGTPSAKRARTRVAGPAPHDLLIVRTGESVTCYSNVMTEPPPDKASLKLVTYVIEHGGKNVLLEDGVYSQLPKQEASKLVAVAHKQSDYIVKSPLKSPPPSAKKPAVKKLVAPKSPVASKPTKPAPTPKSPVAATKPTKPAATAKSPAAKKNAYPATPATKGAAKKKPAAKAKKPAPPASDSDDSDNDHPALNLEGKTLAKSVASTTTKYPDLGGTVFKPQLSGASVTAFVTKAKKLKNKSEDNLFKHVDLEDSEDAVHLYRNFFDSSTGVTEKKASKGAGNQINFSHREIDILCYAELHSVDTDFVWNLMPYRLRRAVFDKFNVTAFNNKITTMLKDKNYVKHLNKNLVILFDGEEDTK